MSNIGLLSITLKGNKHLGFASALITLKVMFHYQILLIIHPIDVYSLDILLLCISKKYITRGWRIAMQ